MRLGTPWYVASAVVFVSCLAAPVSAAVDLSTETATLDTFLGDVFAFHLDATSAAKKATLVQADVDALQRRSDGLKSRTSSAQSAVASIVRKLKAANEYDAFLTARVTTTKLDSLLSSTNFDQLLTSVSSSLDSSELSLPIDNLRRKLGGTASPTPFTFSLSCAVGKVRSNLILRLGGLLTNKVCDQVSCACHPGESIGICGGACPTS